ncbi:hypothetical protein LZC95_33785 [Pendulispora brunnea]|uniref:Uncharacterized protein n=1 Tax=Pendulispora brunnea TaxID=2905690 RepID=A0ABZ2K4Z6_9BACT
MSRLLEATRKRFGAAPRSLSLRVGAPTWLGENDALATAHRQYPRLLSEGHIVLGYVVMANVAMFRLGPDSLPGFVLHPRDPALVVELDELERAGEAIAAIRDLEPVDKDLDQLASLLRAGHERFFSLPVPPALTQGRPLFVSSALLYRAHLPIPRLVAKLLPMLVCKGLKEVAPLPASCWAPDLLDAWNDMAAI